MVSVTVLVFILLPLVLLILRMFLKTSLLSIISKWWKSLEARFHVYQSYNVPQYNEIFQENQLHRKILVYLNSLPSMEDSDYTNLFSGSKPNDILLRFDCNQIIHDTILGAKVSWSNKISDPDGNPVLVLRIKKRDRRRVFRQYFQHIFSVVDEIERARNEIKLYLNLGQREIGNARWRSVPFTNPASFDTVLMDSDLKTRVKSDLEQFLKSKQYYTRLGRVWKRSYLLYGSPGTGKTSFIAAMARFLCYDVYDMDISNISSDSDLKTLLLQTPKRSLIVVEDLDSFLIGKSSDVSLSGVLSFMDGIVSWCGEERVLVFTMNGKDHVDRAVMRPGRIDVHIRFPACDYSTFKVFAGNYLGLKEHKLFSQVEEIFQSGSSLTPAEMGELMISNRNSPTRALKSIITALQASDGERRRNLPASNQSETDGSGHNRSGSGDPTDILSKEGFQTIKEIRKLYGLLRNGSRRKEEPMDLGSTIKPTSGDP